MALSPNDVLFLYEAAGYIIVHAAESPEVIIISSLSLSLSLFPFFIFVLSLSLSLYRINVY